ncbi:ArsR/SmtB family transcription factor [Tetragenococcus halophilus]|uniref:ArsR/SmtB family transcription factor n=1 Tax=Tetragenococcus halophilus TaxID=51669 RepID=UPI001F358090|nr:metalloregulator ArsR/SmtB family transcription factor [Tetragenococcus halophilus]MDN6640491.1 metalloregulator ArsR/SmtB family transcription factor [Tetragenococcus sp.]MCF1602263.1 metalloregulator ArsR/SmtB family transcription factor [Tetragenococcus halophilus]MDN6112054.1 metalloregulator ArsR/SmtB family transcription factor [Tetragenococcus halophilus]MDN6163052.1 metalloregulator ArsR/SmtB family transcription factor [Tetragenococcus halophilus]MDN6203558.1 metalloregulator ArsR/
MSIYKNFYSTSALFGHPTRMAILVALSDGKALPAGEIAKMVKVSPQTTSEHLAKLMKAGFLNQQKSGKYRYYYIANPKVAEVVEGMLALSPEIEVCSMRDSLDKKALSYARTCYGYLAGNLGIQLTKAMINLDYIKDLGNSSLLTQKGYAWPQEFGLTSTKKFLTQTIPYHVDWTERKFHIAGPFALQLTKKLLTLQWLEEGTIHRSVRVTPQGHQGFVDEFGFKPAEKE